MNITLLGCGRWGSFIAWYMNSIKHYNTTVWGREHDNAVNDLFTTRKNDYVSFPESINLTHNLEDAVNSADVIIISISAQAVRSLMQNVKNINGYEDKKYVLCMKGIEDSTGKRLSEVLIENGVKKDNIATWVGPGHIQEFTKGNPNCMIIDSYNPEYTEYLVNVFKSPLIRFYIGKDIVGTEIGAAAKNVIGIAAGMLDGLNLSVLKGALMARGAREISRFIKAMNGNEMSAYGLCHLGDYEATLFSQFSHNRRFGEMFVKGEKFDKLAEGVMTCDAILKIANKINLEMPITETVHKIIFDHADAKKELNRLFARDNIKEF